MANRIENNNTFTIVGKLFFDKEKLYKIHETDTWKINTVRFGVKSGSNTFFLEATGFKPRDPSREIHYFNSDGTSGKVSYGARTNIDTSKLGFHHPTLNVEDGKIKFISDFDFVETISNLFGKSYHEGKQFKLNGKILFDNYIDKNDGCRKEIQKYIVTRIEEVIAPIPENPYSTGVINMYLGDDCLKRFGDVAVLNGKTVMIDGKKKSDGTYNYLGYDVKIEIPLGADPEKADKAFEVYKEMYKGKNDRLHKIGLVCDLLNGYPEVEFTEDMLTDVEKDKIELGILTFEDIKADKGFGKGEFQKGFVRIKEVRGFADGSEETALTLADIEPKQGETVDLFGKEKEDFSAVTNDELPF